jgi:hypothetical protein
MKRFFVPYSDKLPNSLIADLVEIHTLFEHKK